MKKLSVFTITGLMVVWSMMHLQAQDNDLELAASIDLTDHKMSVYESNRVVKGGEITSHGWKMTDSLDQYIIELRQGFLPYESGAIEVDVTNFDPMNQTTGDKQHFINFYGHPYGSQFGTPEMRSTPFFTVRAGQKYGDETKKSFKILWRASADNRHEDRGFGERGDWDLKKTYTWRAEWDIDHLRIYLDGEKIFDTAERKEEECFCKRTAALKYVYLGSDNSWDFHEHILKDTWFGFPGPIYKAVRVYR